MPPKSVPPHYECLGVDPSITDADLSRHYKKLSLQLHPDRAAYRNDHANEVHVQARYQSITEAYTILSDPEKRNAYDTKHGVNFQSRLARLQTVIGQHNNSALQRSTTGEPSAEVAARDSAWIDSSQREPVQEDDDDDDDEDYEPAAVVTCAVTATRARSSAIGAHSGGGVGNEPGEGEAEYEEEHQRARQHFYVQPCLVSSSSIGGGDAFGDELPTTQYRGVTLTRTIKASSTSSGDSKGGDLDPQWGLVFDGSVLCGVQPQPEAEGEDDEDKATVAGLLDIVFPAVVQQINDTMIHPTTDVAQLLERSMHKTKGRATTTATSVSSAASSSSSTTEQPDVEEQLHFVLTFSTVKYDLIGDSHLFCDAEVLNDVVPVWCVAAEMPALLSGVRVLSVNSVPVHSADELRRVLRSVATTSLRERSGASDVVSAAKRPRTSAAVVLECCHLPFC